MNHRGFRRPQTFQHQLRINERIRAREVLVIDAEGHSLGVMDPRQGTVEARKVGLDLVEVSPRANPPVCKILDFGKYRYELAKREKESRKHQHANKVKELKFRINIDSNDYMVKIRRAEGFLFKGLKVKLLLMLRGREMQRQGDGLTLFKRVIADLATVGAPDSDPKIIGKNINLMLSPLPEQKRVRKFTEDHDPYEDEDDASEESGDGEED